MLLIQGHTTQNNPLLKIQNSAGALLFQVLTDGTSFSAITVQAPTTNDQCSFNLQPSSGSGAGWSFVSDILANGTNNLALYNRSNGHYAIHVAQATDFVGLGNGATSTAPWANTSVSAVGTATFSITNATIGYDATSGFLFNMATDGVGELKNFENANFFITKAGTTGAIILDENDDGDNDLLVNDGSISIVNGIVVITGSGLSVGSGTAIPAIIRGSATLDFPNTTAGTSSDLTLTVTGADDGDPVFIGVPNGSTLPNGNFSCWVSGANTVTVRFANNDLITARDPASGTFSVVVFDY